MIRAITNFLLKPLCWFGWHNYRHAPMPGLRLRYKCTRCRAKLYYLPSGTGDDSYFEVKE